jgi:glutamyl-tRNA synthetase
MKGMDWKPDDATESAIRHMALQNALEYEGKAAVGSVIGRLMASRSDLRPHGKIVNGLVARMVVEANELAAKEGLDHLRSILEAEAPHLLEKRAPKKRREGLTELPNAEKGKVVLRFAPNPNGPLSFGHARGLVINSTYREMYEGEFILRFDDTDTKVKPPLLEAYEQIVEEATWLTGRAPDRVVVASDRMEHYYEHAESMLREGFGYVCRCTAEAFKEYRQSKSACPCRDQNSTDNLSLWKAMLKGTYKPGDAVVRVKTEMDLKNPALRDWPALRIQDTKTHPHPRPEVGSTYTVWPLLDFQSAVEDHLQGVTHIVRGKDLMDSTRKQTLLYKHFGWRYPETLYWGRVKVHEWGGFSTSQMRRDVEAGLYDGWSDPRLPTLAALKERGIQPEALQQFWLELGITQKDISVPLSTLYAHNTKAVDNGAPRLSFIRNAAAFHLKGNHPAEVKVPRHPNDEEMGWRTWDLAEGQVWLEADDVVKMDVRLKEFADVELHDNEARITSLERQQEHPVIHWLPASQADEAVLVETKNNEIHRISGKLERHNHPAGTVVQLERIGYARVLDGENLLLCHESASDV